MEIYIIAILIQISIYLLLVLGVNLHFGYTGLGNLGQVAFYCIEAYISALIAQSGVGMVAGAALGMAGAAVAAFFLGLVSLQLRAEFLAIVTLGFAETVRLIALNETWLTRGSEGMAAWQPFVTGSPAQREYVYLVLVAVIAVLAILVVTRLTGSSFGRLMRAIRDSQESVQAIGKSPLSVKMKVLMIGAAMGGLAGSLQAHYIGYISPDQFSSDVTFLVWMAMLIGGSGRIAGSVLGVIILMVMFEGSRFLNGVIPFISDVQMAYIRMGLIGLLLILFARYKPAGLIAEKGR